MTEQERVGERVIIQSGATISQLEIMLHKLGIRGMTWTFSDGRHHIGLIGFDISNEAATGVGPSIVDAIDDALTAFTQAIGSQLQHED